ncbi:MAG TPA: protein kinase, partial [Myxococcaceae bacterium]|nr:protein kinase [Myxococcaceae bacterium]
MEGNSGSPYTSDVVDPLWRRVLNERFTILEPIGSGGMGRVYKAIQSPLERIVALKVLNPSHASGKNSEFRKRFFLEASLTSKLHHPNTITVIDYGHTPDGIFYIAMEYLEGQTL